jgi:hypothetical protein
MLVLPSPDGEPSTGRRQEILLATDYQATMSATVATRTYTPLALRDTTERWLVAMLVAFVAALWCVVIPLEVALGA